MPTISNFPTSHIASPKRHKFIILARKKFEEIAAKARFRTALKHKPQEAHETLFIVRQPVYTE